MYLLCQWEDLPILQHFWLHAMLCDSRLSYGRWERCMAPAQTEARTIHDRVRGDATLGMTTVNFD